MLHWLARHSCVTTRCRPRARRRCLQIRPRDRTRRPQTRHLQIRRPHFRRLEVPRRGLIRRFLFARRARRWRAWSTRRLGWANGAVPHISTLLNQASLN